MLLDRIADSVQLWGQQSGYGETGASTIMSVACCWQLAVGSLKPKTSFEPPFSRRADRPTLATPNTELARGAFGRGSSNGHLTLPLWQNLLCAGRSMVPTPT